MKGLKVKFLKDPKIIRVFIVAVIAVLLITGGIVSWNVYFSKITLFQKYENDFLEAVERYYSFNKQYLPNKLETREVTLEELYNKDRIQTLHVPKSSKLCDSNNSWVRVYHNEKGEYIYTTYLKCGRFESKVDHMGPVIELNGDLDIRISVGSIYEELGVKSVVDKKDGKIDLKNVVIDSSNVDTSKVGSYKVTYTIRDKSYNRTVVTRKVTVLQNLTEVVKLATKESSFYKGSEVNNYILFSGMLWRIVGLDSDGNIKIVTANSISNVSYAEQGKNFNDSNIVTWLNEYFYKSLSNVDNYIKKNSSWCMDDVSSLGSVVSDCTNKSKEYPVGLLTLHDFQSSKSGDSTYLNTITEYWLMNRQDSRFAYIHFQFNNDLVDVVDSTSTSGVRPVINLVNGVFINSGDGSIDKPYKLDDYNYGRENDLLNTRLIGEYVSYFGMDFRISEIDKDGNTKLVSNGYLKNNTTGDFLFAGYNNTNSIKKFNPSEKGNIGYLLNNDYMDYIDQKLIVSHEFELPTSESGKKYNQFKKTTFNTKISIPASYELFAGTNEAMAGQTSYWLLDYVPEGESAYMINSQNGRMFLIDDTMYDNNGFKLVFYVKSGVKISSGKGLSASPYYIK